MGFISCQKEIKPIDIVENSAEAHGGLSSWQQMKSLSFSKKTQLFHEDGTLKKETVQNQWFEFHKNSQGRIEVVLDTMTYRLENEEVEVKLGDRYYQLHNTELENKRKLIRSALYVTSQPFQLLESGASFIREEDTFIGDKKAFALRVHYKGDTQESDQWTYYFDQNSYRVLACKVRHGERVSLIENTSYDLTTPFVFNATRTSTIMENGRPKFVIAKYEYSNYQVAFE